MTPKFGRLTSAVVLGFATMLIAGCAGQIDGKPVDIYADPDRVAGLPTTNGPNGLRPGVPNSSLEAENSDDGEVDHIAIDAVDDLQEYWKAEYSKYFEGEFEPVTKLISWNPKDKSNKLEFCDDATKGLVNAAYCPLDRTIGWDRTILLPTLRDQFGDISIVTVLAHEYGHAIQDLAEIVGNTRSDVIVAEQQADCFAGAFMRHVAEGKSAHFTVNTSDGLNSVLATIISVRDAPEDSSDGSPHGSAFERVSAVQSGFTEGPSACKKIDLAEIKARRLGLPPTMFESASDTGELEPDEDVLATFTTALDEILTLSNSPEVDYSGTDLGCSDAKPTTAAAYCPDSNKVGIDLDALKERASVMMDEDNSVRLPTTVTGDYNAYVLVASRYALAKQKENGDSLTGPKSALRTACLSGFVTAVLGSSQNPTKDFSLSPGDLDEAVSGLLQDGLAASDVDGTTVDAGFSRVDAFRTGVLGGEEACARYS
jgi:predicted metalloprotease